MTQKRKTSARKRAAKKPQRIRMKDVGAILGHHRRPFDPRSLYKPEYCELVVQCGYAGFTQSQMAAEMGVHTSTLNQRWKKEIPEFAAAYDFAQMLAQATWEERLNHLAQHAGRGDGARVSATTWALGHRYRNDYYEKNTQEHSGPGGSPMKITASMSPKDAADLYAETIKE